MSGLRVHAVFVAHDQRFLLLDGFLAQAATGVDVGGEDDADRVEQALAIVGGDARENAAISADLFEEQSGVAQTGDQRFVGEDFW